jgi:hypothetical protein
VCRVEKCSRADLKGICGGLRSGRASPAAQSAKISGESAALAVKPLRRECRNAPTVPVCSCAHFTPSLARETAGAASTRHSLRPLDWAKRLARPRAKRAAGISTAVVAREGGRPSIPEAAVTEPTGRGVLDTRLRGYDGPGAGRESGYGARFPDVRFAHRSSMRRIAPNDGPIPPPLTLC